MHLPTTTSGMLMASFVIISVIVASAAGFVPNATKTLTVVKDFFDLVARGGYRLRDWKERLIPYMRRLPSANKLTLARGLILNLVNWQLCRGHSSDWFIWLFAAGWLTDVLDGLKARWQMLSGPPPKPTDRKLLQWWRTRAGKYLDPIVDIPTILITALILRPYYRHPGLVTILLVATVARFALYGLYRCWAWSSGSPGILPPNISGQSKTWFLATSFGLLIINRTSNQVIGWAEVCLIIGLCLELLGMTSAIRAAIRLTRSHP